MPDDNYRTAYLMMGGNMGDRFKSLLTAREKLSQNVGKVMLASAFYETAAWGHEEQPPFLNQALCIQTQLAPSNLLEAILQIEKEMGRIREEKYGPRWIDIDILFYADWHLEAEGLVIPHPEISRRRFVLEPLSELAPGLMHPVLKKTISELLRECKDPLAVRQVQH